MTPIRLTIRYMKKMIPRLVSMQKVILVLGQNRPGKGTPSPTPSALFARSRSTPSAATVCLHGLDDIGLTLEHEAEDCGLRVGARDCVNNGYLASPPRSPSSSATCHWWELAEQRVGRPSADAGRGFGHASVPDEELLDLLVAAYRVRHFFRQSRGFELSDQRQERAVRRGLRLLLAVAGLEGRNPPLRPVHGRAASRRRPAPPNGRPRPIAP